MVVIVGASNKPLSNGYCIYECWHLRSSASTNANDMSRTSQEWAAAIQESRWIELLQAKKIYVLCEKFIYTGRVHITRAREACGTCFMLGPPDSTWVGICPAPGACFRLGWHGFRWVGPLWAAGAVIHDMMSITINSEVNKHAVCNLTIVNS